MKKITKVGTNKVDVISTLCPSLPCYHAAQDKGTFTPGRGYTSYHKKPQWVCMTRHAHGCPVTHRCLPCNSVIAPGYGGVCPRCHQPATTLDEEK